MPSHTKPSYSRWYNSTHKEEIKAYGIKWREANKERIHKNQKAWRERNKEQKALVSKQSSLRKKYGLSLGDFNRMREAQHYQCAICGIHETEVRHGLCVDHCHATNKVRNLLCRKCNALLGHCLENPEILWKAINYLENWKAAKGK